MELCLRGYQDALVEELKRGMLTGHWRQFLYLATGGGKSVCAAALLKRAHGRGTPSCFVVDRQVLVEQISAVLDSYDIPHGVIMAKHWRYRPSELIQVASAQTLEARGFFPGCKLAIVDEAHIQRKEITNFLRSRPEMFGIGLSATPFAKGLGDTYSRVVSGGTTNQLIAEGVLVRPILYAATPPDMVGAETAGGEWTKQAAAERSLAIIGDIVPVWIEKTQELFGGPQKTIVFVPSVDFGAELCQRFNAAGYRFEQISYKDRDTEARNAKINEFKRPDSEIMGLVSVEALARGFDVPDVMVGIEARPLRKSLSTHIQMMGRVMRSAPGKTRCLWLCHSGNVRRFLADTEAVFEDGVTDLAKAQLDQKARAEPEPGEITQATCSGCGYVLPPRCESCPACGRMRARRKVAEVAGTMVLVGENLRPAAGSHAWMADKNLIRDQLIWIARRKWANNPAKALALVRAKFKNFYNHWPEGVRMDLPGLPPCDQLLSRIRADNIRHYHAQKRRAA